MISLEQLLDGLEVSVEPLAIQAVRRNHALDCGRIGGPTMHYALRGSGLLKFADGESVGVSARTVIVVPPGRQAQIVTEEDSRGVDFRFASGMLTLTSKSADVGQSVIQLPISYDGEELAILFDPRFIARLRGYEATTQTSP